MKGLISAIIKRTRYGTWVIRIEIKTDKTRIKILRKLRLIGIFVKDKGGKSDVKEPARDSKQCGVYWKR